MSQAQSSSGICPRCYSLGPPETTLPPPQRGMCFRWISGDISFVMTSGSNLGGRNLAGNVTVGYCVPTLGNPIVQVMQHRRQSDSPRSVVGLGPDGLQAGNVTKGITAGGCGSGPRFTCTGPRRPGRRLGSAGRAGYKRWGSNMRLHSSAGCDKIHGSAGERRTTRTPGVIPVGRLADSDVSKVAPLEGCKDAAEGNNVTRRARTDAGRTQDHRSRCHGIRCHRPNKVSDISQTAFGG